VVFEGSLYSAYTNNLLVCSCIILLTVRVIHSKFLVMDII